MNNETTEPIKINDDLEFFWTSQVSDADPNLPLLPRIPESEVISRAMVLNENSYTNEEGKAFYQKWNRDDDCKTIWLHWHDGTQVIIYLDKSRAGIRPSEGLFVYDLARRSREELTANSNLTTLN